MTDDNYEPIEVYWDNDGEPQFEENQALAVLFRDDKLMVNSFVRGNSMNGQPIKIYAICNDIFAWGMADLEPMTLGDIQPLYDMYAADKVWGTAKWCCLHRNEKPQKPVEEAMRKAGVWDAALGALPENRHSMALRKYREQQGKTWQETKGE